MTDPEDSKSWSIVSDGETKHSTWILEERPKGSKGTRMEYRGIVRAKGTKFEYRITSTNMSFCEGTIAGVSTVHDSLESYIQEKLA